MTTPIEEPTSDATPSPSMPQTTPVNEMGAEEFTVPLHSLEETAKKIADAERVSRLSMLGIIILSVVGVTAIVIMFALGKPEGATAVSTMLVPTIAGLLAYRKGAQNNRDIQEVRVSVDGRLSQLLRKTDTTARAEGQIAGAASQRTRRGDVPANDSTTSISSGSSTEEGSSS